MRELALHYWWIGVIILLVLVMALWRVRKSAMRVKAVGKIGKALDRILKQ